jgi:hypothetical protein
MPSKNKNYATVRAEVVAGLEKKKLSRPDTVIDTIATTGAGYLEARSGVLKPIFPEIPAKLVAKTFVGFYRDGEKPKPPIKAALRSVVRGSIDGLINGMNFAWPTEDVRATLTSIVLGIWSEERDEKALRGWLAGYVVALYTAGLD